MAQRGHCDPRKSITPLSVGGLLLRTRESSRKIIDKIKTPEVKRSPRNYREMEIQNCHFAKCRDKHQIDFLAIPTQNMGKAYSDF